MKKLLSGGFMVAILLAQAIAGWTHVLAKGDKLTDIETDCKVVRIEKPKEQRVVFVLRCADAPELGIADIDIGVYYKGGNMLLQLDKEEGK